MILSKIVNITKSRANCYDITVDENHNFFANRCLIHNSDYRGEIKVIIYNASKENFYIEFNDRIAQIFIEEVHRILWNEVEELSTTIRNSGGFGHTGSR